MADIENPNLLCSVVNAVEDAILADPNSPTLPELAFEALDARRARIAGEREYGLVNLFSNGFRKSFELSSGS